MGPIRGLCVRRGRPHPGRRGRSVAEASVRPQQHADRLLASAYTVVAALATVPAGVLTDRLSRTRALTVALLLWAVAMVSTGAAITFALLLASRAFLGVVQAVAGPAVPSLDEDLVGAAQRSRAMAVVDSGDVAGMGIGYVVAGLATALFNWRWAFLALAPSPSRWP